MSTNKIKELVKLVLENMQVNETEVSKEDENFSLASMDAQIDKRLKAFHKSAQNAEEEYTELMTPAEDEDADDAKKQTEIDINRFTQDVIKMTENFVQLIEIEDTVFRRAAKYLKHVHGTDAVEAFKDALAEAGFTVGKSEREHEADVFQDTFSVGSGPGGA